MRAEPMLLDFGGPSPHGDEPTDPDADLRFYQREGVEAAWAELETVRSTAIVFATGMGKTRTGGAFIRRWLKKSPLSRVLWVAHRDFLIDEAARRLRDMCGVDVSIEKAERRMSSTRIVVGSTQTLRGERLRNIPKSAFDLIVWDEVHHAASPGAMQILNWFTAKVLGLTATLVRHDKVGAWNAIDSIAIERDIQWAMTEGFFVPIVPVARFIDSIDLSQVKTTAGDLNLGQIEEEIAKVAAPIAQLAMEEMGDRPTLIYTPGVASAHAVAATLNHARPNSARAVDADTPPEDRKRILQAFDRGEIQWITNCAIFLEGLDVPKCRGIVVARPTKSEPLYVQIVGRGGRPEGWIGQLPTRAERVAAIAASSKPNFILLDVSGHAGRHSLCSAATLAGKETPAKQLAEVLKANPGIDLQSAAAQAKEAVKREQAAIAKAAREAEISSRRESFDVFSKYGIDPPGGGLQLGNAAEPATLDDIAWLESNKIPETGMTHGAVLKLQRTAAVWRKFGYATFKQRRTIGRVGLPTPHNLPFAAASTVIDHIFQSKWRPNKEWAMSVINPQREAGQEG